MRPDRCPERQLHEPHEWIGPALRVNCPGGMFVVAGTGSRSLRIAPREVQVEAQARLNARVDQLHTEHGDRLVLMSGLAEGWDELVAVTALARKIRLWAAIPNRGYGVYYWQRKSVTEMPRLPAFLTIVAGAWEVTHVMEDAYGQRGIKRQPDGLHSNFVRNDWMVTGHGADFAGADDFAVWNPTSRGTAHCVKAIKAAGKWRDDMVLSPQSAQLPLGGS